MQLMVVLHALTVFYAHTKDIIGLRLLYILLQLCFLHFHLPRILTLIIYHTLSKLKSKPRVIILAHHLEREREKGA
ncbi:hypothetical protein HanRHA438_Chr08g0354091 [Helianthus annuus]|uniref:Uncharacterized protein n=1 Tax=Helianthus annuus TaxID=4232 RepID=A0A251U5X4_HELAN|nr:hypothetical protein HanXRQr2_Chr08g0342681 [Helianthus annuus]KAJ0539154.1 hypothetical protein HanHA300_Chr08g0283131 [Helianthus annuus]KAJ0553804.1 hypothetical protein HanHA89_Chr08g0300521 [Helianthus annuus]KAJ0719463.1 hypothetical protein HanLR1_Chr08g0282051 [Helianthus annuus]KAJ0722690.1 hypothetical protein HanOQP8_Chr08g0289531 [Helianthus annuus]